MNSLSFKVYLAHFYVICIVAKFPVPVFVVKLQFLLIYLIVNV